MNTGQLLAFGAGTFCLGIAFTFGLIFSLVARHGGTDRGEGCFGMMIGLAVLMLAAFFFVQAI